LSVPRMPEPARLVVSILSPEPAIAVEVQDRLVGLFGPVADVEGPLPFPFTSYYDAEMGSGIERWMVSFGRLVDRGELAGIKCLTNDVERTYTVGGNRRCNLDPGLLTLGNFVLATGKNNSHRIYLSEGIFADLTLVYKRGSYRPLEWTYPDYADERLIAVLNTMRQSYKCQLKDQGLLTAP
jgi:hypothetical protein